MNKILMVFFLTLMCFSFGFASQLSKENFLEKSPHLRKLLESGGSFVSFDNFKDIGPLYEVIIKTPDGKKVVYITKDFDYLILGSLYDKEAKNVTQERVKELNKIDISTLPLSDALIYKVGNGDRKIIVFVDPFCPHCKKIINHLKTKSDYSLYMYIFPLNDKSKETSLKIFCTDKSAVDAYLEAEKLEKTCDTAKEKLEKHINLAQKFNLRATPFVILGDGSNFYGANLQLIDEYFNKPGDKK